MLYPLQGALSAYRSIMIAERQRRARSRLLCLVAAVVVAGVAGAFACL